MTKEFLTKVNLKGNRITDLGTPESPADAATKQYVDDNAGGGGTDIAQQNTAPASPATGDLWLDTDEGASVGLSSIIAYAEKTSGDQTGITNTITDLNGLSVSVSVPSGRRIRIKGFLLVRQTGASGLATLLIREGSTIIQEAYVNAASPEFWTLAVDAVISPTAGMHTYKLSLVTNAGSLETSYTATRPGFILVEDITGTLWPAGAPINGSMLAADTVSSTELQASSVGTSELQDNSVSTAKIQDNAITAAKIPIGVIPENRLDSALQTKIGRAVESPQTNLTMQADSHVVTSDSPNGYLNINYPTAFGATPQCVVLTNGEDGQGVFLFSMVFRNAGSFTARLRNTSGGIAVGFLVRLNWIACLP